MPFPFFILGGNAFTCINSLITPANEDNFNDGHSAPRFNIECAFGKLIRCWGILWRPLQFSFKDISNVLHNTPQHLMSGRTDKRCPFDKVCKTDSGYRLSNPNLHLLYWQTFELEESLRSANGVRLCSHHMSIGKELRQKIFIGSATVQFLKEKGTTSDRV